MSAVQLETRGVRLPAVGVTASCEWPVWLQRAPSGSSGRATTHLDSGSISPALILWILSLYQTQYAAKDDHKRLILSEVVRLQAPTSTSGLMLCWQLFYYLEYFPSPQLFFMTMTSMIWQWFDSVPQLRQDRSFLYKLNIFAVM